MQTSIPQTGRIVGGALDTWYYTFRRAEIVAGQVAVVVLAKPSDWPFPVLAREVRLMPGQYERLEPALPATSTLPGGWWVGGGDSEPVFIHAVDLRDFIREAASCASPA